MSAMATEHTGGVDSIRYQASLVHQVVRRNVEGISHEESLLQPEPGGNCLNWVVGHLVWAYAGALPLVRQSSTLDQQRLAQYARGGPPLTDPTRAVRFDELLAAWDEASRRMDAGLADFPTETLAQPAPGSPTGNPGETIGSLLATIMFHQAYHTGQTAVLRRLVGREGAIK
jgi:DinB family protein